MDNETSPTAPAPPTRIRILVVAGAEDDPSWADWRTARDASPMAQKMALQRVSRDRGNAVQAAVGLGYGESLRWFGPVVDGAVRRLVINYAEQVLEGSSFPPLSPALQGMVLTSDPAVRESASRPEPSALPASPASHPSIAAAGRIVLLSHAETDLLALDRAREDLPADFPLVTSVSLNGVTAEALAEVAGEGPPGKLVVIVRVHGAAAAVPGLTDLLVAADGRGVHVVVISGIGADAATQPRTASASQELAASLTAYFMAGGVTNITQALRLVASELLGFAVGFQPPAPMPAHGLYHPDLLVTSVEEWEDYRERSQPVAIVLFYRAHVLSGNLRFVDHLVRALQSAGLAAVGVFTSSLRERDQSGAPAALGLLSAPAVVVNTVSYPMLTLTSLERLPAQSADVFELIGAPLIQAVCCGTARAIWHDSPRGLSPTETAMNIALPECDGRLIAVPVSFKENHRYVPDEERISRVAQIARRLVNLRLTPNAAKRVVIVLSNTGGKAQKVGGAVGLDTPTSLLRWLRDMREHGYAVGGLPDTADELMAALLALGCYDEKCPMDSSRAWRMPRALYVEWFRSQSPGFRRALREAWGEPEDVGPTLAPPFWRGGKQSARAPLLALNEPHTDREDYLFSALSFGNVLVAIQPPRGFGIDQETMYHSPDLPPCHHYAAFYRWIADGWGADAVIHFGTHGTLEWLPGKSVALSEDCAPDALLGDLPLFYPFVINNPGEGAQAKRRTHAAIVAHLVPPLTQAETYGPLTTLARLVEEYYRAESLDPAKLPVLRAQIWELVRAERLEDDLRLIRRERHADHVHSWDDRPGAQGIPRALERLSGRGFAHLLEDLDAYLCDLGRAQIRSGLHVFGVAPTGTALVDLMFAVLCSRNGDVPALGPAVARACGISPARLREPQGVWSEPLAPALVDDVGAALTVPRVRAAVERLGYALLRDLADCEFAVDSIDSVLARRFGADTGPAGAARAEITTTLRFACEVLVANLARTTDETRNLFAGLEGRYIPAGPSGAPSRGMAHVLPTGRNFYTVDPRGLPTPAAWTIGEALAREVLRRHAEEEGRFPEAIALSVWGTPTMRTGGDEIAQALAFLGVRPTWDPVSRRTCGIEVIQQSELGRPRVDVTLRVSGFFRDAFPALMQLFDEAVRAVIMLDEPVEQNYPRKHWLTLTAALLEQGVGAEAAALQAGYRVFSSKPGAYGTGLMELIENRAWHGSEDLAEAAVASAGWAYASSNVEGVVAGDLLRRLLRGTEVVLHGQDNREQDLFDSSDYFEYQGGLLAAVAHLRGARPSAYFSDSSDTSRPEVRTLQAEGLRVFRSRVVNPKWLAGMQRHGHRGGLEMAATVDAVFGFAATAGIVTDWMFEAVAERFAMGGAREFLERSNPWALNAIAERLLEAEQRGLWSAKPATRAQLRSVLLASEATIEERAEGHT